MTDEQFKAELSPEYLEWSERPGDCDITGPVEEIQRLCEVIVGLRAQLAGHEAARAKATGQDSFWCQMCRVQFEGEGMIYRGAACAIAMDADVIIAAQAAELAQLRASLDTAKADRDLWRKNCEGWAPLVDFIAARGDFTPGGHAGRDAERIILRQDAELSKLRADLEASHQIAKDMSELAPFEERARRVINWAFGGEHHVFGLKFADDGRACRFTVPMNNMGTYDRCGLTKLVVACHDECVRGQLADGGPGRVAIRLSHRARKHKNPDMCAHPTLEQHVEQIRKGGSYHPLFDQLRAEDET